MSEARIGWGAEVQLGTSSSAASLVELVEVVSFGLPNDQADEVEVTTLKSANKRKEYIRGLIDGGHIPDDVTIEVLTQAREHLIRRTMETIRGAKTGKTQGGSHHSIGSKTSTKNTWTTTGNVPASRR